MLGGNRSCNPEWARGWSEENGSLPGGHEIGAVFLLRSLPLHGSSRACFARPVDFLLAAGGRSWWMRSILCAQSAKVELPRPGLAGVALMLLITGSSLNIMSLMGVIMMAGIVVSNSILIVEFAGILHQQDMALKAAVVESCKVRLRPILMTSLATLLGMIPMALGLEAGSEQYAPLARAIIGGLALSVVVTMFLVPAVYLVVHGRDEAKTAAAEGE